MYDNKLFWKFDRNTGEYTLMERNEEGRIVERPALPRFYNEHHVFKDIGFTSIIPIEGAENDHGCYVYDAKVFKQEEITAPVMYYAGYWAGYLPYTPVKTHTGTVFTLETVNAANKVAEYLMQEIRKANHRMAQIDFDWHFSNDAAGNIYTWHYAYPNSVGYNANPEKYLCINCSDTPEVFNGLIILKEHLPINGNTFEIQVPSDHVGVAIGRKGENAKKMAQLLGVRYVKVTSK